MYSARQPQSQQPNHPAMEVNDVIFLYADKIHQQNLKPENLGVWCWGKNSRTGHEGFFPGLSHFTYSLHLSFSVPCF